MSIASTITRPISSRIKNDIVPPDFPLDSVGVQAYGAYSPWRLYRQWQNPTIRLRRTSDNAQMDFTPQDDEGLNLTAISAWTGGSDPAVVTLYDQTGSARHASQATTTLQPLLELSSGDIVFDTSDDYLLVANSVSYSRNIGGISYAAMCKPNPTTQNNILIGTVNPSNGLRSDLRLNTSDSRVLGSRRLDAESEAYAANGTAPGSAWERWIASVDYTNGSQSITIDGSTQSGALTSSGSTSDTDSGTGVCIGATATAATWKGSMRAAVLYQTALSAAQIALLDTALFF